MTKGRFSIQRICAFTAALLSQVALITAQPCQDDVQIFYNGGCKSCSSVILRCNKCKLDASSSLPSCQACEDGYSFDLDLRICKKICQSGQSWVPEPKNDCVNCPSGCTSCEDQTNRCLQCSIGFQTTDDPKLPCKKECKASEKWVETNECKSCHEKCADCDKDSLECRTCQEGYFVNSTKSCQMECGLSSAWVESNTCANCPQDCLVCQNKTLQCLDFRVNLVHSAFGEESKDPSLKVRPNWGNGFQVYFRTEMVQGDGATLSPPDGVEYKNFFKIYNLTKHVVENKTKEGEEAVESSEAPSNGRQKLGSGIEGSGSGKGKNQLKSEEMKEEGSSLVSLGAESLRKDDPSGNNGRDFQTAAEAETTTKSMENVILEAETRLGAQKDSLVTGFKLQGDTFGTKYSALITTHGLITHHSTDPNNPKVYIFSQRVQNLSFTNPNPRPQRLNTSLPSSESLETYSNLARYYLQGTTALAALSAFYDFETFSALIKFNQITRVICRSTYINLYFGESMRDVTRTFSSMLGDSYLFNTTDLYSYSKKTAGKFQRFKIKIFFYDYMFWMIVLYLSSYGIGVVASIGIFIMVRRQELIEAVVWGIKGLRRVHLVIFWVIMLDFVFFTTRTMNHVGFFINSFSRIQVLVALMMITFVISDFFEIFDSAELLKDPEMMFHPENSEKIQTQFLSIASKIFGLVKENELGWSPEEEAGKEKSQQKRAAKSSKSGRSGKRGRGGRSTKTKKKKGKETAEEEDLDNSSLYELNSAQEAKRELTKNQKKQKTTKKSEKKKKSILKKKVDFEKSKLIVYKNLETISFLLSDLRPNKHIFATSHVRHYTLIFSMRAICNQIVVVSFQYLSTISITLLVAIEGFYLLYVIVAYTGSSFLRSKVNLVAQLITSCMMILFFIMTYAISRDQYDPITPERDVEPLRQDILAAILLIALLAQFVFVVFMKLRLVYIAFRSLFGLAEGKKDKTEVSDLKLVDGNLYYSFPGLSQKLKEYEANLNKKKEGEKSEKESGKEGTRKGRDSKNNQVMPAGRQDPPAHRFGLPNQRRVPGKPRMTFMGLAAIARRKSINLVKEFEIKQLEMEDEKRKEKDLARRKKIQKRNELMMAVDSTIKKNKRGKKIIEGYASK